MKTWIQYIVRKFGFDLVKLKPEQMGKSPFVDMTHFIRTDRPMMFDVGANRGQTVNKLREFFSKGMIHSFEPSPSVFEVLRQNVESLQEVQIWNCGIGSKLEQRNLIENRRSVMSSFLKLGETGMGEIVKETQVEVQTIDQFCVDQNINIIDILKIDTQGYDLEVLNGAQETIAQAKVGLIYLEVIFSKMYEGSPSFDELFHFLINRDFLLVSIYPMRYQNNLASWTDLLFVHKSYIA